MKYLGVIGIAIALFILFVLLFFTGKIRETVPQVENQPVASEPLPFYPCDPTKEKCV